MHWYLQDNLLLNLGTVLVFVIIFYVSKWYITKWRLKNMPPGPPALPIIGSLPWMTGADIRKVLDGMRSKYGDIFTIYFGGRRTVILSELSIVKDAFIKHSSSFIDRPQDVFFVTEITMGLGVVSSNGDSWKKHRSLLHTVLRDLGVGSSVIEEKIVEETEPMIEALCSQDGPIDPHGIIQMAVANVIGNITFNVRHDYDDPKFVKFMKGQESSLRVLSSILNIFPQMRHLPGDLFGYHRMKCDVRTCNAQHTANIEFHKETHQLGVTRSVIDAYLHQIETATGNRTTAFSDAQLLAVVGDLFGAGTETTSTVLVWCIVYMLRYPSIHARLQKEVDDVIGSSRSPSRKDRREMPFTEACILEVLRLGDVVPLSVPRVTTRHLHFHGYDIPKGTTVMPCLYSIHQDERIFSNPSSFNPDRFLDDEGHITNQDKMMPFSVGKRNCLGESLARMELFLMFTSMIQRLEIRLPDGQPLPEETGVLGITHAAKPFEVIITRR